MADILRTTAGLGGESEVRRLLREHDWTASPLGPPDAWPPELATAVSMAFSSAFPMFVAWGPDLRLVYNDAYIPILGDKHPAAFGAPFQRAWAEIWPELVPITDRALSNKSAYFEDQPFAMERNGYREPTWFTFSYSPLHDGQGRVAGVYCTCIETTRRVQAERRAAFELAVADALRPPTSDAQAIRTGCAMLGRELGMACVLYGEVDEAQDTLTIVSDWRRAGQSDAAGQTLALEAFGPELARAGRDGDTVVLADVRLDPRAAGRQGTYLALGIRACIAVPLRADGRLQAFVIAGLDRPHPWSDAEVALARGAAGRIHAAVDLARVQATLREERDRSQTIFDTIAEGFMLLDRDWTVLQMNAEGARIAHQTADQVVGRNHWDVWPESIDSEASRMYRRVMRDRTAGAAEYRQRGTDGSEVWCDVRAYPTADGGIVSFFRDITERKRAEDQLRAADRRKDEFLAMLAHELRNPLAPISAAADLLRIGRLDEARVRQSSAIIGRQVRHMTSLVDDLLDVSRVTRGLVTLARASVAARTIVDEAVEQVRPMFEARRQHVVVDVAAPDATVLGDRARLVQVLANLLNNAAKYTPEERRIDVAAGIDAARGMLLLTVRDQGIGMEPELTGHVFDLFTQGERPVDRTQGGLGLGLALVKNLVELHGGTVACSSPGPGLGSTFEVALPLAAAPPAPPPSAQEAASARDAAGARRLCVLVVDDNVDAADTLGMLLEAHGYGVEVEHDSHRALERARARPPDVALLDIGLPDMDGNELARRLRADVRTAATVLVAVTGYGQEQDRRAAFEAGFDHHLVKPVDMEALTALLGAIAAGRENGM